MSTKHQRTDAPAATTFRQKLLLIAFGVGLFLVALALIEGILTLLGAAVLPDHPEVHLNLGLIYQRTGRLKDAADELEQAVAIAPDSPEARFNLGVVHGRLGRLEEGVAGLE